MIFLILNNVSSVSIYNPLNSINQNCIVEIALTSLPRDFSLPHLCGRAAGQISLTTA